MTQKFPLVRLVDDDELFRTSQALMLQMNGFAIATYASAQEFLERDDPDRPGCVILDVRMPTMTGLELQEVMQQRGWRIPILFLTGHGDISMAVRTMQLGAVDFLEKPVPPAKLVEKVRHHVEASLAMWDREHERQQLRAIWESLTPREQQVIVFAVDNLGNKEIAQQLTIAETTVKMHRANAFAKFGINNALDAYRLLSKIGVLSEENSR